jgi:hypothetical protein
MCRLLQQSSGIFFTTQSAAAHGPVQQRQKINFISNKIRRSSSLVCFPTKNPNLGKFWRAFDWKMFIYFMAIWNILRTFGKVYDHLVHFELLWYISSSFGIS